jgi:hypothetical protein
MNTPTAMTPEVLLREWRRLQQRQFSTQKKSETGSAPVSDSGVAANAVSDDGTAAAARQWQPDRSPRSP